MQTHWSQRTDELLKLLHNNFRPGAKRVSSRGWLLGLGDTPLPYNLVLKEPSLVQMSPLYNNRTQLYQNRTQLYQNQDHWTDRVVMMTLDPTSKTSFRDVGDRRSAITLLKTYGPTQRALIQTRRGEIDYGEQSLHGFVKSMFWRMTSLTNPP